MATSRDSETVPSNPRGVNAFATGRRSRLQYDERRSPLDEISRELRSGELNLDPPYQRGHVWGVERQQKLIWSLLAGLPIGGVWINERDILEPRICVDGKQRLTAIAKFIGGDLPIPAGWLEDRDLEAQRPADDTMVTFADLSLRGQRRFRNSIAITIYFTKLEGDDAVKQEQALFDLINFGGVTMGADADSDAPDAA